MEEHVQGELRQNSAFRCEHRRIARSRSALRLGFVDHHGLRPDPRFRVEGHNLRTRVDVAPWEAALGARVDVPTLEGTVTMRVPPGTQSGQTLRLRGKGLPRQKGGTGDLLAEVRIVVPKTLNSRERELFEQLARDSRFQPREPQTQRQAVTVPPSPDVDLTHCQNDSETEQVGTSAEGHGHLLPMP